MEKKIQKWLEKGLLDKDTAIRLLTEIKKEKEHSRKLKLNITIYTIAIVFIAIGVLSFIAANDWILELFKMCEAAKVILMMLFTVVSLWGGHKLAYEKKNFPRLGKALIFLSSFLIGGTYALITQIYNIDSKNPCIWFLWLLSVVPLAYYFRLFSINVMAIVLFIIGMIMYYDYLNLDSELVWTIFMPVLLGSILYSCGNIPVVLEKYNNFSLSYKLTGALAIFVTLLVLMCSVESSYYLASGYYLLPIIAVCVINILNLVLTKNKTTLLKIETTSIVFILLCLLLMIINASVCVPLVMVLSNVLMAGMITFGFYYGYEFEDGKILSVTNWMLIIYLLVNYCRWGWSYMDKSLFFTFGGISLLCLGLFLEKKRKLVTKGGAAHE